MTKSRKTKGALLVSALSLLLCVAMLVGSTFAWFTDSVTTGVNKIVAGNLDVELEYATFKADGTFDKWAPVQGKSLFSENALWEPGHTEVVYLKVTNKGTLALKYQFSVSVEKETKGTLADGSEFELSKYLVFGQTVANGQTGAYKTREEARQAAGAAMGLNAYTKPYTQLNPKAEEYVALIVYMPTTVGNEANYRGTKPEITLGVELVATQAKYEQDSFGNDYDADAKYDPYAEKDKEALAADPKNAYRKPDGSYVKLTKLDNEIGFLSTLATQSIEATLIRDIGAVKNATSTTQSNYSNKHSTLDLNGHTYTFGGFKFQQSGNAAENSSLVIKDGTMVGSTTGNHMLYSYNAMQTVTLDHVHMKWNDGRAWNGNKYGNYYGLNLTTKTSGSLFTVKDSVLDCNASFSTNSLPGGSDELAVANITNTEVNGRLHGAGLTMNVDGCTVNGEVYCNANNSSKTRINIKNSTINGNAFFSASSSVEKNEVTISNTVIDGNLLTDYSYNNIHITLTNVTITGTLRYPNLSAKVPADRVTIVSGTYGFDPTNYLAAGSLAVQNGDVWVVTAN